MSKLALVLALVGVGLGGYALFGPREDDGPEPASVASLEALRGEVETLKAALATAQQAHGQALTRLEAIEETLRSGEERMAQLEAAKPEAPTSVTVQEVKLVTAEGTPLLRLGATSDGAGEIEVFAKNGKRVVRLFARSDDDGELALYDEDAVLRANIGGNDDGGYANFYGRTGTLAAYLGADSREDCGFIGVYGAGKKEIVGLYGNEKGGVISVRNGETENQILMIGAAPNNGMGFVGLGTSEGKAGLALYVTETGGQIKAMNADEKTAAFLGVSADPAGNGLMYVARKDGNRLIEAGATSAAGGYISVRNGADERVLFMGASTGEAPDDGVLEVAHKNGKLGVVLRAYSGGSSVRVYDDAEKVKVNLR